MGLIVDGSNVLAAYNYLGESTAVQIQYPLANVMLDLWGGTSGVYNGFDRFGRIIDQRWINYIGGTVDIDRYKYGYERNSNRTWKENTVSKSLGTPVYLDEYYTYDNLNRLTVMKRGQLSGIPPTGISGTPGKEQDWTLDKTGNWSNFTTKTTGTTDLNQTRTSNTVNELTGFTTSTGTAWATPAYDAAGNTITMPQPNNLGSSYTTVYDAWNRMISISDSSNTVAQYQYDGRGRRAVKLTYTGGTLSETRHFYWSNDWQDLEERTGTSTNADQQYVWGVRYVDELICRDDATPARYYSLQDANFNLTSITDDAGTAQERYVFYPYGQRLIFDASWGSRATSSYDWAVGHQGLMLDAESGLVYNRNRYLHPRLGRFVVRDSLEYADGTNVYQYVSSTPPNQSDPLGLYEANFHWGVIYYLHKSRCWSDQDAWDTADASQAIDDNPDTNPINLGFRGFLAQFNIFVAHNADLDKLAAYHFPGSAPLPNWKATQEDDKVAGQNLNNAYRGFDENGNNGDFKLLGRWLHTYADSYSHAKYSAYPRVFIDVGHLLADHYPDKTSKDVMKALRAANAIWQMIPDRCACDEDPDSEKILQDLRSALEVDVAPIW